MRAVAGRARAETAAHRGEWVVPERALLQGAVVAVEASVALTAHDVVCVPAGVGALAKEIDVVAAAGGLAHRHAAAVAGAVPDCAAAQRRQRAQQPLTGQACEAGLAGALAGGGGADAAIGALDQVVHGPIGVREPKPGRTSGAQSCGAGRERAGAATGRAAASVVLDAGFASAARTEGAVRPGVPLKARASVLAGASAEAIAVAGVGADGSVRVVGVGRAAAVHGRQHKGEGSRPPRAPTRA